MSTNAREAPVDAPARRRSRSPVAVSEVVLVVAVAAAVVSGIALRMLLTRTPLWLDEAQTVAIARLPLSDIPAALRQDGHPPLYYVLLHGWMQVFGQGDGGARSLSAVFGVLTLVPLAALARRMAGASAMLAGLALAGTSPFLVRYATEARMYSLVALLVLLWWLAVQRAVESPRPARVAAVAVLVGALLLTHYWSVFLFLAAAVTLGLRMWRSGPRVRSAIQSVAVAHVVGGLVFVPWVPSLLVQLDRTGTPWADPPNPVWAVMDTAVNLSGGLGRRQGVALYPLLIVLVLVGVFGRALSSRRIELDLTVPGPARAVSLLVTSTTAIGLTVVLLTGSGFATRYLSVVVPFVVVLAARGVAQFDRPIQVGLVGAAVVLGLAGSWSAVDVDRSQGAQVAEAVERYQFRDSIAVACPDQLGPATARYLPAGVPILAYPLLTPAGRVDWTDYEQRNDAADPRAVADRIVARAGGNDVWLVWQPGYRTLGTQCEQLRQALTRRLGRPVDVVWNRNVFEPMRLSRFRNEPA